MSTATRPTSWPKFSPGADPVDMLVELSRYYGSDPTIVLAGGGNTSVKVGDRLHVKASGHALATIDRGGFVEMDRPGLENLAASDFGPDPDAREAAFKKAIHDARIHPDKGQRPSVECLLHHMIPGRFVVHSHATLINALTCLQNGDQRAAQWFGDEVLWVPYIDPGFALARELRSRLADYRTATGRDGPSAILMANHGLIVAGDDPEQIRVTTDKLLETIAAQLGADWKSKAFGPTNIAENAPDLINQFGPLLRGLLAEGDRLPVVTFDDRELVQRLVSCSQGPSITAAGPLNPDQIVYCNSFPLWFSPKRDESDEILAARLRTAIQEHTEQTRFAPKVVLVEGLGMFTAGEDYKSAANTRDLYLDATTIMAGAQALGQISHLTDAQRRFIEDWEVEAYRRQIAAGSGSVGRAAGRIAVVTGAAQGFGLEIAQHFVAEGGHVVLSDINADEAGKQADQLSGVHGRGRGLGLAINVTDRDSISACLHQVVRTFGGFDVFVSNAGVLKAESVKTQDERDFRFVTDVNYTGYFLCVQQAAPILSRHRRGRPGYLSDIIQINSKSGLVGSNRNGAYAGSKFGSIGLTQSFALELIEDGVKVNAICPGNFFDGPLWSDPGNGLFVQYLRSGKVPGAKTIEDVRRSYEAKVPMGRGCRTADVVRAIFYLIEQEYETGQAVPVTGGQVMLN